MELFYQSLEWQPWYQQFYTGLVFLNSLRTFNPLFLFFTTPSSFYSFLSTPFPQSFSFLFLSLTSLCPYGISPFYLLSLCSCQHGFCFTCQFFYLFYTTTYIPTLILAVISKFIKSGTEVELRNQLMHRNKSNITIYCEYLLLNQVLIHTLEHGEVSSQSCCLSHFLFQ